MKTRAQMMLDIWRKTGKHPNELKTEGVRAQLHVCNIKVFLLWLDYWGIP